MMIVGFGLVGAALRRRRRLAEDGREVEILEAADSSFKVELP
jgi:prephenate dehydrogenase